jgi:hypothetical protein
MTELEQKIIQSIASVCQHAAKQPMCFFSEADLQAQLYEKIHQAIPEDYPTGVSISGDGSGSKMYKTSQVHREYGAGFGRRYDLVVFTPEEIASMNDSNLTQQLEEGTSYVTPSFAIEMGTEKSGDSAVHVENDLEKLKQAKQRGFLIHIFRDTVSAPRGSQSWLNRDERIIAPFRKSIAWGDECVDKKIVVIALLLILGIRNRPSGPRCQIFLPKGKKLTRKADRVANTDNWYYINLEHVAEHVESICQPPAAS